MWSSIQPLPGVCSSGWLRKKLNRPPGRSTRAISAIAPSTSSMCSNTRHATAASNDASANGSSAAPARAYAGPPPRSPATLIWFQVGIDADDVRSRPAASNRLIWPSPHPTSSTRSNRRARPPRAGGSAPRTRGRHPPVNPSIHQPACLPSHRTVVVGHRGEADGRAPMKFSVWPNPAPSRRRDPRHWPGWPTPRAGTGSGTPTTTCRTPAARRSLPATRTSAGRSCRRSRP